MGIAKQLNFENCEAMEKSVYHIMIPVMIPVMILVITPSMTPVITVKTLIQYKKGTSMEKISIKDEFIKLGQAMKLAGIVENGGEAKDVIANGEVTVNGEVDTRRGKKLCRGDVFSYNGVDVRVE